MAGTTQQTHQEDLDKLIKHWPGHYIVGSKPYKKGCVIYLTESNQVIDTFKSNDQAYSTMINHLTGRMPWWPGKKKEQIVEFFNSSISIQPDSMIIHSTAIKILNLRDEADRLMKTILIDPFDNDWKEKIINIINKRRK